MSRDDADATPIIDAASIVALIPAAGRATRLGALPCSKEIFPVGFKPDSDGLPRPEPVSGPMLRSMGEAGIERALWILRDGKWDVASRLGDGAEWGIDLGYLAVRPTRCVPETLARALPWTQGADVALGFPDILLRPGDVWRRLVQFHRSHDGDMSLGLFPTDQAWKADMVDFDAAGRLLDIRIKDPACTYHWTWSIAIWRPRMTTFLQDWVEALPADTAGSELYVGDVWIDALKSGLDLRVLPFEHGTFLDIGTPDDLRRAVRDGS